MSHMYIMAYDDMFRSDSTIFRFLRAIYHATYSSKCAMGSYLHCLVQQFFKNTGMRDSCVKIWKNVLDGYYPILQLLKLVNTLCSQVCNRFLSHHFHFHFCSSCQYLAFGLLLTCLYYIAGIDISSYDAETLCKQSFNI